MVKEETESTRLIPSFKYEDQDTFLFMVHVALQIRGHVLAHPKSNGIHISEDRAIDRIPNSPTQNLLNCNKHIFSVTPPNE